MPQGHSILYTAVRKYFWPSVLAAVISAAPLVVGSTAWAEKAKNDRAVRLLATIKIPPTMANNTAGGLYSFDISWVDQASRTYYLADRSNAVIDIIDTASNILLAQLTGGFKGFMGASATSGPNGVTTGGHCLFVTDSPSRVVSFDTTTFPPTLVNSVSTGGANGLRADELAYAPGPGLILAINNEDKPPFGTLITVTKTTCALTPPSSANRITFDAMHGVDAQNGAEQPVWDPATGKFYLSIPQIGSQPEVGGVVPISTTGKVGTPFKVKFCSPGGLTVGPKNDLLVGCNLVFDTAGGLWTATDTNTAAPIQVILNVITGAQDQVGGVGASDEVWFNKGDGNYYTGSQRSPLGAVTNGGQTQLASSAAILGVIDATDEEVLQLVPTYNVPAKTTAPTYPSGTAHSVAVDAKNNHIFVPLPANNVFPDCLTGCIAVYWHGDEDEPGEAALP